MYFARGATDTLAPGAQMRSLTGMLLVARPGMPDPRFRNAVIFMVRHDASGALGLIVNRPLGRIPFRDLITGLGGDARDAEGEVAIGYGGPVEPRRGFVLYSTDYPATPLIAVNDRYAVTMSIDILRAMATGHGPKRSLLAIGYAGWGKRQLQREMARGDWFVAPADDEILFDDDVATKWKRAYDRRLFEL